VHVNNNRWGYFACPTVYIETIANGAGTARKSVRSLSANVSKYPPLATQDGRLAGLEHVALCSYSNLVGQARRKTRLSQEDGVCFLLITSRADSLTLRQPTECETQRACAKLKRFFSIALLSCLCSWQGDSTMMRRVVDYIAYSADTL
jgi:hypothetical protein